MLGLAILLGYQLVGYLLHEYAAFPLPGNVLGLMLLVLSLFAGWVKLEWIEQTAQFMTKHMMIFFAPTIVGTMMFFTVIGEQLAAIAFSLAGSTLAVLLATAWFTSTFTGKEESQ